MLIHFKIHSAVQFQHILQLVSLDWIQNRFLLKYWMCWRIHLKFVEYVSRNLVILSSAYMCLQWYVDILVDRLVMQVWCASLAKKK